MAPGPLTPDVVFLNKTKTDTINVNTGVLNTSSVILYQIKYKMHINNIKAETQRIQASNKLQKKKKHNAHVLIHWKNASVILLFYF